MKKRFWLTVLLAILAFSGAYALAQARLNEMTEAIKEQLEEGEERDILLEGVEAYMEEQDEALSQLEELVAETSESELKGQWDSIVQDMLDLPELADLDDELSSEAALALYNQFVDEERAWFLALSQINPVAYRDQIVQLRIRLANMTELLETKWQGFLNDDGQLDQKELEVMADINGIVVPLAEQSDASRQKLRDSIQIVTDLLTKVDVVPGSVPGEVASAITQTLSILAETAKQYNSYKTTVETLRPQLRELVNQELGLLVIFNDTREDTQLFVEQNNFDKMKALYGEAEDELESFVDVGTDGQQSEAEDFVDLLEEFLSKHVSEGETIFNTFVTKHKLKFFGPIGPDIKEYLAETQVWLAEGDKVKRLDLAGFLSKLRSDANSFFGVSLSVDGITDYEREFLTEQLRSNLEAAQKAIDEAGVAFSTENLSLIYDRRDIEEAIK